MKSTLFLKNFLSTTFLINNFFAAAFSVKINLPLNVYYSYAADIWRKNSIIKKIIQIEKYVATYFNILYLSDFFALKFRLKEKI